MIRKNHIVFAIATSLLTLTFCVKDQALDPIYVPETGEEYPGGEQTTFIRSQNAFGQPMPGLVGADANFFFTGNSLFNQNWVAAPASTTARDGLGPTLNAKSCSACHFKDGRGRPPMHYDETSTGFLVRLSIDGTDAMGNPNPDPNYGGQFNDQAIYGITREGQVSISYSTISGTYSDGSPYELQMPSYTFAELNFGPMASNIKTSPRVGQQMIGLGLLEAIEDNDLLANSDPNDSDGDGISGKPNYVWNVRAGAATLGKFGWKANQPSIEQQVAGAFKGDLGITSNLFPDEDCPGPQAGCFSSPNGGSPEIDDENLAKVVLYSSNLAVPFRPDYADKEVLEGKDLFNKMNCVKCHVSNFTTGLAASEPQFRNQKIWPYTDLLLHDMGVGLADGRSDFEADGNEWRTPPLWGIGLFETVNGHTLYLHDGRARNLEEAILWHGGEALSSKNEFENLTKEEREKVIKFLKSL